MPDLGNSLSDYDFYRNDRVKEQQKQAATPDGSSAQTFSISHPGVASYWPNEKNSNEAITWGIAIVLLVFGAKHIYRIFKPAFDYLFRVFSGAAIVVKSKADGLAKLADESKKDSTS